MLNNYRTEKEKKSRTFEKTSQPIVCIDLAEKQKRRELMTNSRPHWNVADRLSTKEARGERSSAEEPAENEGGKKIVKSAQSSCGCFASLLSPTLSSHVVDRRWRHATIVQHSKASHSNGHFFRLRFALSDRSLAAACLLAFFALNIQLLHRSSVEFSILSGADVLRASKLNFFSLSLLELNSFFFLFLYSTLLLWNSRVVATLGLAWVSITSLFLVCLALASSTRWIFV